MVKFQKARVAKKWPLQLHQLRGFYNIVDVLPLEHLVGI